MAGRHLGVKKKSFTKSGIEKRGLWLGCDRIYCFSIYIYTVYIITRFFCELNEDTGDFENVHLKIERVKTWKTPWHAQYSPTDELEGIGGAFDAVRLVRQATTVRE